MKILLSLCIFFINIYALKISSADDYKIIKNTNYNIIYTNDFKKEAIFIQNNINSFLKNNNNSFGYKLDEPITIILISNNIQVKNAFSTQTPYNLGVYYSGGGASMEYFSNSSWLKTLFVHETAHNYQLNAKKSNVSKTLHKIFKNNTFPIFISFLPLTTLVNYSLPNILLEGNAVLNESIYGIGGRLYSGKFMALKNTLILNNKINPNTFINNTNDFPVDTKRYIVGGFYMQYLASIYGINKVNKFFYENSTHFINPFLLNQSYLKHFHISFNKSVNDFIKFTKNRYKNFNELKNKKPLSSSKSDILLSKIENKIYFISSNNINKKELNIYDIKTNSLNKKDTKLSNAKIFKVNNKLYTSTRAFINPNNYKQGLYDENKNILKNTSGKAIQSIYKNNIAYINIKESFLNSKLYINNKFYSNISSSALYDKNGNIYYFKQNKNKKELYKNKKLLISLDTYYAKLVDIYKNDIYFISNTANGSSLYKYSNNKIYKISPYDNITNAKIIDDNNILAVVINEDSYNVNIIKNNSKLQNIKTSNLIHYENSFKFNNDVNNLCLLSQEYNEFKELRYSSLYPSYGFDSYDGYILNLNATFIDPLMFNYLNINTYLSNKTQTALITYSHQKYISTNIAYYTSRQKDINNNTLKEDILNLRLSKTIYKKARHSINTSLSYYFDTNIKYKKPIVFNINHTYSENFSLQRYPYLSSSLDLLAKKDRTDKTFGFKYKINKHLFTELYVNIKASYLKSSANSFYKYRGIKISQNNILNPIDNTNIYIEGLNYGFYAKDVSLLSLGFVKRLNYSSYFSKFIFSLKNEDIFVQHNEFEIKRYNKFKIKEDIIGINLDILFAHNYTIPFTFKYIKNDFTNDNYKVKFSLGLEF